LLVRSYFPRLQDDSFVAFASMFLKLPDTRAVLRRGVPMLVLGADEDRIIGPSDVRRTARTYRAEMEIFPGMGHDMMVEPRWQQPAERIQHWIENGQW
jgi:pimeloyl-ACP methyl ester carboxylesterase